ncbi:MAG: cation:proton antiporter [Candidatus Sumerlaeaceae bacterium]|nr:cation:proton antiporter [Candidatus Sumerlaeaceae bacterium]
MKSVKLFRAFVLASVVAGIMTLFGAQSAASLQTSPSVVSESLTTSVVGSHDTHAVSGSHEGVTDTLRTVLLDLIMILLLAKIGGEFFQRMGQPAVLGELIFGIILGNLTLLHLPALDEFVKKVVKDPQADVFITLLSEIGVMLLLFEVGLESTVREMMSVGMSSFLVAVLGVVTPMLLGFGVACWFLPSEPWTVHLFIAAVLAATSVGITARVLRDLGKMHLREAKIVLGAAVIDDVLGLIVVAVAQGMVLAANTGQSLQATAILLIIAKAGLFFAAAMILGGILARHLYRIASYLRGHGVLLIVTLMWCFGVAYIGMLIGLAPIVGAFAAGLVLESTTFKDFSGRDKELEELLAPITTFLVPVFFVHMGMQVDLTAFGQFSVLGFAACLTLAAIIGKQACSLGVLERGLNRLAVGVGMIPRGEVGLIVAGIGTTMKTAQGHPVISTSAFSATVIMVIVTTMITPPVLKWVLSRGNSGEAGAPSA